MADRDTEEIVRRQIEPITGEDGAEEEGVSEPPAPSGHPSEVTEPATMPRRRIVFHSSWVSIAIWAGLIIALVVFFAFGSVTIYPRGGLDREMRVDRTWALFRNDLPQVYHQSLLSVLFYGAIALVVIGMAWMIFLALGTRTVDVPAERGAVSADTAPPRS